MVGLGEDICKAPLQLFFGECTKEQSDYQLNPIKIRKYANIPMME
jgi:hypothetical protein